MRMYTDIEPNEILFFLSRFSELIVAVRLTVDDDQVTGTEQPVGQHTFTRRTDYVTSLRWCCLS